MSPTAPLELLLPVICDKCEFSVQTTVLLRDAGSEEPLDTTKTLNELGLRELFAKDTDAREPVDHQHRAGTPEAGERLSVRNYTHKDLINLLIFFLYPLEAPHPKVKDQFCSYCVCVAL